MSRVGIGLALILAGLAIGTGCTKAAKEQHAVLSIVFTPGNPKVIYVGTSRTVYRSTDGGTAWTRMSEGLGRHAMYTLAIDPQMTTAIYAGTFGNAVYLSHDGGRHWALKDGETCGTAMHPGLREFTGTLLIFALAIDGGSETSTVYAGTASGLYRSTDSGACWTAFNDGLQNLYVTALTVDPSAPGVVYAGTTFGLFKSTNRAQRWVASDQGMTIGTPPVRPSVSAIAINPARPTTLYVGTYLGVFTSVDGGKSWTKTIQGLTTLYVQSLVLDPTKPDILYAGTNGGIYKSTDGAQQWAPIAPTRNWAIRQLAVNPEAPATVFAATETGLFVSRDAGAVWQPVPLEPLGG